MSNTSNESRGHGPSTRTSTVQGSTTTAATASTTSTTRIIFKKTRNKNGKAATLSRLYNYFQHVICHYLCKCTRSAYCLALSN